MARRHGDRACSRVLVTAGLLFAMFQYLPLQDLGIRFRLGTPELLGTLAVVAAALPR